MEHAVIRRALGGDAPALAAAFRAAYAADAARIAGLPDVAAGLGADIAQHLVWVAEAGGDVLGGLVASVAGEAAHLMNVGVVPEARGTGLGGRLIGVAIAAARDAGASRIDLATHVGMPGNLDLYRRLGWQETGREGVRVFLSRAL